jgi:hypothetical protein
MVAENVKTQDFTEAESRRVALRAILRGDLRGKGAIVIFAAILEAHDEENIQLMAAVKYAGEALNILKGQFREFRARTCKAAWALTWPGSDVQPGTSLEIPLSAEHHAHDALHPDARDALAALAALETSGYAPVPAVGTLIPGTGTGEPPIPPRYETRPGAMHRGSAGLPSIGRGKHS